jgi:methionine-gamma-lyase
MSRRFDPMEALARTRHEFGEHGGVNMSVEASTPFTVMHADTMPAIFTGLLGPEAGGCYLYGRHFNPTVSVLGRQLAAMKGCDAGYCTSSGMSAISAVLMQLCDAGDRIVASDTVYGGTFALLKDYLPLKAGVETEFVDEGDFAAVEEALARGAKVLYVETMANPTLHVADIPELARLAHAHGARLVVDNTFCPLNSLTKFVNGASDIIAGAIVGDHDFVASLMDLHVGSLMILGPTMDPRAAFNISLRLPNLGLRVAEHSRRAQLFAERLEERGLDVIYPGLPGHPDHERLAALMNPGYGYGGLFCLDLKEATAANELLEHLQNDVGFGYMAVSLGYFDTLMSLSASSTSSELTEAEQRRAGISPGLVRISIGYTGSMEQRWEQFAGALDTMGL